jgi:hypothetical protein
MKGWKKIFLANGRQYGRVALTSDKIHFKSKAVQREQFEKFKKT